MLPSPQSSMVGPSRLTERSTSGNTEPPRSGRAIAPAGRIVFGVISGLGGLILFTDGIAHVFPTGNTVRLSYIVLVPLLLLIAALFFSTAARDLRSSNNRSSTTRATLQPIEEQEDSNG